MNNHRFYQYPRGENKGGILDTYLPYHYHQCVGAERFSDKEI